MKAQDIADQALELPPTERFEVAERILHSLDRPDPIIDAAWLAEAARRLAAYRAKGLPGTAAEDVVGPF